MSYKEFLWHRATHSVALSGLGSARLTAFSLHIEFPSLFSLCRFAALGWSLTSNRCQMFWGTQTILKSCFFSSSFFLQCFSLSHENELPYNTDNIHVFGQLSKVYSDNFISLNQSQIPFWNCSPGNVKLQAHGIRALWMMQCPSLLLAIISSVFFPFCCTLLHTIKMSQHQKWVTRVH